jgi:hypothetical protein
MTDEEPNEQSSEDSEQSDEKSADASEQSAEQTDQSTGQAEQQPTESDQVTGESEEQPAESDQPAQQAEAQAAEDDQTGEQPVDSDQPSAQSEEQPAESDQPATAATGDDTQEFAAGDAFPAAGSGASGGGPAKTTKVQVIAIFMTDSASSRFRGGSITMNVFDGAKGNLLWKLGSMDQQKVTFQDAGVKSNIISSAMFSGVTGDSVKVELKVKMLGPDHELDPTIPEVNFGTAARFEVPTDGTLKVAVDVETTSKEFTVDAKDEQSARDAASKMLTSIEEIHLARVDSAVDVGGGQFRVVFRIPTKRIRILQPKPIEVIYP